MPYHITENVGGGAEVQAWLLAKELARLGFRVTYIAQSVNGKAGQYENLDGVQVRWVRHVLHFKFLTAWTWYRALVAANPDMVVQRMTSFETGVAGVFCGRHNKPLIWVCSDNSVPERWFFIKKQVQAARGINLSFIKAGILLANAAINDLSRHYGMKRVTTAFTQNDYQQFRLKRSFNLRSHRIVSGHEIPPETLAANERLKGGTVLWVGNLGLHKRPEKFIELARLLEEPRLRCVMIGGRKDPAYIKSLFRETPKNFMWIGPKPFSETLQWFRRAAFFVNTSVDEGFPNTFIHAWMHGVPVLSLGADPDQVISRNGLGYVSERIDALAAHLKMLSSNLDQYCKLSQCVKNYASKNHQISTMTNRFLASLAA